MFGRDKHRGEGGPVGYTGDDRAPLSPRSENRNNAATFPEFGGPVSSVHPAKSHDDMFEGPFDEKVGDVRRGSVEHQASVKPGHDRTSSYGFVDGKR